MLQQREEPGLDEDRCGGGATVQTRDLARVAKHAELRLERVHCVERPPGGIDCRTRGVREA